VVDDRADNPESVILEILANGPVVAKEFRRLAYQRGVPVKDIRRAARAVGAKCRKYGGRGQLGGGWQWELSRPADRGIVQIPGRRGYYAKFLFHGTQICEKLSDDFDTAKVRIAELYARLESERAANPPPLPRISTPRKPRIDATIAGRLRLIARDCIARQLPDIAARVLRECGAVAQLEKRKD
jgi:hypothetical protein